MSDAFVLVKVSLAVALAVSVATFVQNSKRQPVADPWFMPVILVLLWQSLNH